MRIRFDKIDVFIRIYDGKKYLVLFRSIYAIYNRIKYPISVLKVASQMFFLTIMRNYISPFFLVFSFTKIPIYNQFCCFG